MNRKGRRLCVGTGGTTKTPTKPSLWPLVLAKALKKEKPIDDFVVGDVREKDYFAGKHDTSINAVFFLLRDVIVL